MALASRLLPVLTVVTLALPASQCTRGAASTGSILHAVATVDEVMDGIVIPSSQIVFDAVVYSNGELVQSPKNDDDWFGVRVAALAVAEAGNLLMMPPRAKDAEDWQKFSRALRDAAVSVARATDAKDLDQVLQTGSEMYTACTACHAKYITGNP
jgi:hypothetical protein